MKKILSILLLSFVTVVSCFSFVGCNKKDSTHPSKYIGKYFFEYVTVENRWGSASASIELTETISNAFTTEGFIQLNKDGSVDTNLFEKCALFSEPELGYVPTYESSYTWRVRDGRLYLSGYHQYYDQNNKPINNYNYSLLLTNIQYYILFKDKLYASGSYNTYTWTLSFTRAK